MLIFLREKTKKPGNMSHRPCTIMLWVQPEAQNHIQQFILDLISAAEIQLGLIKHIAYFFNNVWTLSHRLKSLSLSFSFLSLFLHLCFSMSVLPFTLSVVLLVISFRPHNCSRPQCMVPRRIMATLAPSSNPPMERLWRSSAPVMCMEIYVLASSIRLSQIFWFCGLTFSDVLTRLHPQTDQSLKLMMCGRPIALER